MCFRCFRKVEKVCYSDSNTIYDLLCFDDSLDTDGKWLAWLEQRFKEFAGSDRLITFKNFQKAFNLNDVYADINTMITYYHYCHI